MMQRRIVVGFIGAVILSGWISARSIALEEVVAPTATPPVVGRMDSFRDRVGQTLIFKVTGQAKGQQIWGTDVYTDDSPLPVAVVHAGMLIDGQTGFVSVTILPGQDGYVGSRSNEITSDSYGKWQGSYRIEGVEEDSGNRPVTELPTGAAVAGGLGTANVRPGPTTAQATAAGLVNGYRGHDGESFYFKVTGATGSTIWGSDPYTDDSPLAVVAVHAGLLKPDEAGVVRVIILSGMDRYTGKTQNGVTSQSYAHWDGSYRVERVAGPTTQPVIEMPPLPQGSSPLIEVEKAAGRS